MRVIYLFSLYLSLSLSQAEALSKKKHQSRQIQTSNTPTFPQHTLRGPAGSASATPTSSAHGPVHVFSGSYVAARSSTAASLPALMQHTVFVLARECAHWMPRRYHNSSFHHYQLWKSSLVLFTNSTKETASKLIKGKERGRWLTFSYASPLPNPHVALLLLKGMDGLKIIAFGICRPIICSTFCLVHVKKKFFSLLGTLAGWKCCGASKIAQTAHTVCFMVYSDR